MYTTEPEKEYPSNLRASTVRSTWVTFSWDRIRSHSKLGNVTGYQIDFIGGNINKQRIIPGQEFTAYTFMELTPCTYYELRVAAFFRGSRGDWSPPVGVTTSPGGMLNQTSMHEQNTYMHGPTTGEREMRKKIRSCCKQVFARLCDHKLLLQMQYS